MYKTLCVAVLLLVTLVLAGSQSTAVPAATFNSPQIVAKGKLSNQTTPFPTTTIFTPTQTGMYRLSVYATISTSDPNSHTAWIYNLGWTDDAGAQSEGGLLYGNGATSGQFQYGSFQALGGTVLPFEAKAGTPITHSMSQSGPPDSSAYTLYYTLERLE